MGNLISAIILNLLLIWGTYVASLPVNSGEAHTPNILDSRTLNPVWDAIPAIPPPQNMTALIAARLQILASIKETCLDPRTTASCSPPSDIQANAITNVVCETSKGSPEWVDAIGLANWVKRHGRNTCPQLAGVTCTSIAKWGTAAIGICSTPKKYKLDCFTVGTSAGFIADDCVKTIGHERKVGGKYVFDDTPTYDSVINLFRSNFS